MSEVEKIVQKDQVEGLTLDEDPAIYQYSVEETFLIRTEPRTAFEVVRRMEKGSFIVNPEFQRDFSWSQKQQSELIESILMRIPLPVFYLAEDKFAKTIVVDGVQRLTTLQNFLNNRLKLELPHFPTLHGKMFSELSSNLQNRIEDCSLILYIIDVRVPERARLDIFDRVNRGTPLTRQQMRNSLYLGLATRFLKEEATTQLFVDTTGESLEPKSMRDREFVNRFCAFQLLGYKKYKGSMDEFLADALTKMNQFTQEDLNHLSSQLRTSLRNNAVVFDKHAFRKLSAGKTGRSVINASIWDVMSVGLSEYPEQMVEARKAELKSAFLNLLEDSKFINSVTYATNDVKQVIQRFSDTQKMLKEVFDD